MENYCLNDRFAYCKGQPRKSSKEEEWIVTPDKNTYPDGIMKKSVPCCGLDLNNCGLYQKSSEK